MNAALNELADTLGFTDGHMSSQPRILARVLAGGTAGLVLKCLLLAVLAR